VAAAAITVLALAPARLERSFNTVPPRAHPSPSARAIALHRRLTIVDLHADSLLWARDLGRRSSRETSPSRPSPSSPRRRAA
jgi:membrane dipeptidase